MATEQQGQGKQDKRTSRRKNERTIMESYINKLKSILGPAITRPNEMQSPSLSVGLQ